MTWSWQEPYNAALLEKDPGKLPERLVTAEKAILQRIQELPDSMEELPESRALREALDYLYALCPQEFHPPGEIRDATDDQGSGRNWLGLIASVGLALFLLFATRWVIERRNAMSEARRVGALEQPYTFANSPGGIIAESLDDAAHEQFSRDDGFRSRVRQSAPDPHLAGNPDPRVAKADSGARKNNTDQLPAALAASRVSVAKGVEASAENEGQRDSTDYSLASTSSTTISNPAVQPNEQSESTPSFAAAPGIEGREKSSEKSEVPHGSVSVTSSSYPSLRIPPELTSAATLSAASLQIGAPISRPDPIYPEEAERQAIEGKVTLRVIIGRNGAVKDVEVINGPTSLVAASVSAVRQWRYRPTFLGDQPIEISEEITIVFRLASTTPSAN